MPIPSSCCSSSCPDVEVINVPGAQGTAGADGADGTDGVNGYAIVAATETDVVPAIGGTVTVTVDSSDWIAVGMNVYIEGLGYFEVTAVPTTTTVTLEYLDCNGNTHAGDAIAPALVMSPAGPPPGVVAPAAGDPEGAVVGSPGMTFYNTTDGSFWVKATGSQTNTGWIELIASFILFCSLLFSMAAPPIVRQYYTTNSQDNVAKSVTNSINTCVATNRAITNIVLTTTITNASVTNIAVGAIAADWTKQPASKILTNWSGITNSSLSFTLHVVDALDATTNQLWFTNGLIYATNRY